MSSYRSVSAGSAGEEPTPEDLARFEQIRELWTGPPENVIPVAWPFTALVGRSEQAAVAVIGGQVYPTGLSFRLIATVRSPRPGGWPGGLIGMRHPHMGAFDPREVLRFGVRYPDGRVADSLADGIPTPAPLEVDGTQPRLLDLSGGGGDRRWEQDMFLAPLPPDGSLELVCEWPGFGIAESRAFVDLTGLAEAVARTVELWPQQPEGPWTGPTTPRLGEPGAGFFRPILDDPE